MTEDTSAMTERGHCCLHFIHSGSHGSKPRIKNPCVSVSSAPGSSHSPLPTLPLEEEEALRKSSGLISVSPNYFLDFMSSALS